MGWTCEHEEPKGGVCYQCQNNGPTEPDTVVKSPALKEGLAIVDQAIEALERLAEYHDKTNKVYDAESNREYIKVIKGQQISHRLVEERLNS